MIKGKNVGLRAVEKEDLPFLKTGEIFQNLENILERLENYLLQIKKHGLNIYKKQSILTICLQL